MRPPITEQLMEIDVTSVSKRPEKLSEVASAIQVITRDDIRRSGASSIAEALRLADNLNVAQKHSHAWAITARGFNTDLANRLLVLIDGRAVYAPLFSGVFWDLQDYLLEDVERIEVISGPGGTLWGGNAVNGVINIITRKTVPSYCNLTLQVRWNLTARFDLSPVGQNLLHDHHPEYGFPAADREEIERSAYAKLAYRY